MVCRHCYFNFLFINSDNESKPFHLFFSAFFATSIILPSKNSIRQSGLSAHVDKEVGDASEQEFERGHEPALAVDAANGKKQLHEGRRAEDGDEWTAQAREGAIRAHREQSDNDRGHVGKGVDVKRVDEVLDVVTFLSEIKDFQDEREERDAAEHHRRDVASEGVEEKLRLSAVRAESLFDATFYPLLKRTLRVAQFGGKMHAIIGH